MGSEPKDPLIQKIEDYTGVVETAVLWGYLGDVSDGNQRLYIDLTRRSWIDIDINDIKMSQHLGDGRGSLVWVMSDATVTQVAIASAGNLDIALGFLAGNLVRGADWIYGDVPVGPPKSWVPRLC